MTTDIQDVSVLRFEIDPVPGEAARACSAIVRESLPRSRRTAIVIALYVAVIAAAWLLTPATRALTTVIGVGAVLATVWALQVEGRSRVRRLQASDPHATETHFIELSADGVHTWCAHVDSNYPWQDFTKVVPTTEFYLFVRGGGNGSAVPMRLLGEEREDELRERIRQWSPEHGASLFE